MTPEQTTYIWLFTDDDGTPTILIWTRAATLQEAEEDARASYRQRFGIGPHDLPTPITGDAGVEYLGNGDW